MRPDRGSLLVTVPANLDFVAGLNQREEFFQVALRHADAAMRRRLANRLRRVGSVDPVAFAVQPHPAIAERVVRSGGDDLAFVVVGRIDDADNDVEGTGRAGRALFAGGNRVDLLDLTIFDQRHLVVGDAHQQEALVGDLGVHRKTE